MRREWWTKNVSQPYKEDIAVARFRPKNVIYIKKQCGFIMVFVT